MDNFQKKKKIKIKIKIQKSIISNLSMFLRKRLHKPVE
jgi:hypothetical protein